MKKILVTGGAGFIGSNFIHYCLEENNKILNFDLLTYAGNLENLENISQDRNYTFVKGDICDSTLFLRCLYDFKPDFVVNFAAESHVDRSIDGPERFITTNIIGTYKLLSCCQEYHLKLSKSEFRFLHISTDEVYGSLKEGGYFIEKTAYQPSSPYSASKASSDHLVNAWNKTFSFPSLITNCSNNYGPYQFPEKLIPLMIVNALDERPLPIYGTGNNIRDWLYVKDHCDAIYAVLLNGKIGETYNIGGNEEKSNLEIVNAICKILDELKPSQSLKTYKDLIKFVDDRPGHDFRYAIDSSKIRNQLGWVPKESFTTGLNKTIHWFIKNYEWVEKIKKEKYNLERLGINR